MCVLRCVARISICCNIPGAVCEYVDFLPLLQETVGVARCHGRAPFGKGTSVVDAADPSFIHPRILAIKYSRVPD